MSYFFVTCLSLFAFIRQISSLLQHDTSAFHNMFTFFALTSTLICDRVVRQLRLKWRREPSTILAGYQIRLSPTGTTTATHDVFYKTLCSVVLFTVTQGMSLCQVKFYVSGDLTLHFFRVATRVKGASHYEKIIIKKWSQKKHHLPPSLGWKFPLLR